MKLRFTGFTVENFGSFGKRQALDLNAFGPGLHYISGRNLVEPRLGSNGSGKSTLWNAFCWCLYGRTPDGRRNPDIAPRFGDKHTTVVTSLQVDRTEHVIARSTNPNNILLNDEKVEQDAIDQLLGLSVETFCHTILLGQDEDLFFDLTPSAKMTLFGSVLNLDRWDTRSERARTIYNALALEQNGVVTKIEANEANQQQLDRLVAQTKQRWEDWHRARETEIKTAKTRLQELVKKKEGLLKAVDGLDLKLDGLETELRAAQRTIQGTDSDLAKLTPERDRASRHQIELQQNVRHGEDELTQLGEADNCPTCGQALKGTNLGAHKRELRQLLLQAKGKLREATAVSTKLEAKLTDLRTTLKRLRSDEASFKERANRARDDLDRATRELAPVAAQIDGLKSGTKRREDEVNPFNEQQTELRRQKSQLQKDLQELQLALKSAEEKSARAKFWIGGFKDVRLFVVEDILQELELTANALLTEVGLIDWEVSFDIERETKSGTVQRGLNVFIRSPLDKDPVRWECWSGGEKQRLRLIGTLALAEVLLARAGIETDLEIFDEPTTFLSAEGVVDLCEMLSGLDRKQIFYVDHMSVDSTRFASTITVVKTKDGSELRSR